MYDLVIKKGGLFRLGEVKVIADMNNCNNIDINMGYAEDLRRHMEFGVSSFKQINLQPVGYYSVRNGLLYLAIYHFYKPIYKQIKEDI